MSGRGRLSRVPVEERLRVVLGLVTSDLLPLLEYPALIAAESLPTETTRNADSAITLVG